MGRWVWCGDVQCQGWGRFCIRCWTLTLHPQEDVPAAVPRSSAWFLFSNASAEATKKRSVCVCQVCVTNTVLAARLKACACKPDELPSEDGAPSRSQPRGKSKAACRPSLATTRLGGSRGSPDEFSSLATVGQSTKREPNVATLWWIAWSDIGWRMPCSA